MKVQAREIEQRQMVLEIEVENERVEQALDQAYKRIANRINVPGFRRGRAPRPLVERMVGREAILEDAVEHLVPQVYKDALAEQHISPVGQPSLEVTSTEPLHFKATVPLEPSVHLGEYGSIDIPLDPITADDTEVEEVVENLRQSNATWAPVERAVQIGDRVGLSAKAMRGERTIMNSPDAEFVVNPTGPEPATGFSEQLVGMEPGQDRSFTLGVAALPAPAEGETESTEPVEDAASAETAAPEPEGTQYEVTLHWVKEKQLPELDEEFARTVAEQDSIEGLRDEIRQQIRQRKEQQARERQREAIVQAAVDQARVDAPPQMIEARARQLLDTMAATLDRQGISVEQYLQFTGKDEDTLRSELMTEGEAALKRSLVLEAIAKAEGLAATEAEVREEIELAARGAKDPTRATRQALARPETRARIESILMTRIGVRRLFELTGAQPVEDEAEAAAAAETDTESADVVEPSETTGAING